MWEKVTLGECVNLITGFPFKSKQFSSNVADIRLLRGDNIAQGSLRWEGAARWPMAERLEFGAFDLSLDDVVLAMDRPWIEAGLKWAFLTAVDLPALLVQRVARLRSTGRIDQRFLRYVIAHPDFTSYVKTITTGANIPHISGPDIRKYQVNLPPLDTQRRIAAVLSAYDDLIENNTKRIRALEEMARAVYREWFVHFRYPGHEAFDRALLPDGWTRSSVGGAFETFGGGTPSRKEPTYWAGGTIPWFSPTDLTRAKTMYMDGSEECISQEGLAGSSATLFPAGSVMLTSRATIGAIAINTTPACTNQGFITCRPNERVPQGFLYHWLVDQVPNFLRLATGSTFKEITRGVFRKLDFVLPPRELVERFEGEVTPLHHLRRALERRNRTLREARDLLLPKLLSGELSVDRVALP